MGNVKMKTVMVYGAMTVLVDLAATSSCLSVHLLKRSVPISRANSVKR